MLRKRLAPYRVESEGWPRVHRAQIWMRGFAPGKGPEFEIPTHVTMPLEGPLPFLLWPTGILHTWAHLAALQSLDEVKRFVRRLMLDRPVSFLRRSHSLPLLSRWAVITSAIGTHGHMVLVAPPLGNPDVERVELLEIIPSIHRPPRYYPRFRLLTRPTEEDFESIWNVLMLAILADCPDRVLRDVGEVDHWKQALEALADHAFGKADDH